MPQLVLSLAIVAVGTYELADEPGNEISNKANEDGATAVYTNCNGLNSTRAPGQTTGAATRALYYWSLKSESDVVSRAQH